jgi:hypothetical protein
LANQPFLRPQLFIPLLTNHHSVFLRLICRVLSPRPKRHPGESPHTTVTKLWFRGKVSMLHVTIGITGAEADIAVPTDLTLWECGTLEIVRMILAGGVKAFIDAEDER